MNDTESTSAQEKRIVPVLLYERDLGRLEELAAQWGTSLAGAVRHLIRETETKSEEQSAAA